jgi:hypothetical protein
MKIARTTYAASGKRLLASVAVALSAGLALSPVASATDDEIVTCSLKTLRGVYQFRASGFNIANGVTVPKAIIETLVFDGHGNVLTPEISLSIGGTIVQPPQGNPGVYTVDADCTGTLTFADNVTFDLQIAPRSKTINMLQTNQGSVMQGSAVRVLSLSAWGGG